MKKQKRAAIPKSIVILDQMPMTGVGKIFKPPLRCDALRRVYTEALSAVLPAHAESPGSDSVECPDWYPVTEGPASRGSSGRTSGK